MEKKRHVRSKGAASFGIPRQTANDKVVYRNKAFSGPMVFNVSAREPRSPEVSCFGHVKRRSKTVRTGNCTEPNVVRKLLIVICRIFPRKVSPSRTPEKNDDPEAPRLVHMRKFASESQLILMAGEIEVEPKEEVNLWKRRTTAPPTPLQLTS